MKGFAVLIGIAAVVAGASAQSPRAHVEAMAKKLDRLMLAKDIDGLTRVVKGMVTPDFRYVEAGTSMNVDRMCAGMSEGLRTFKKLSKVDSKIVSFQQAGDKVTATTVHAIEGTGVGPDKKSHKVSVHGTSVESYVKRGTQWKLAKMAWVDQTMKIDGRPLGLGSSPTRSPKVIHPKQAP